MQFHFAFKHMEVSESLKNYSEQKIGEKIQKFVTKPIDAKVTFSVEKHTHTAHCHLVGGDGFNVEVEYSCEDMYGSIDKITDKLETQLRKQKEKLRSHRNPSVAKSMGREVEDDVQEPVDDFNGHANEVIDAGDIAKMAAKGKKKK
jgi:putative sigma-54 modulation protein